jgi:hypothetical protein
MGSCSRPALAMLSPLPCILAHAGIGHLRAVTVRTLKSLLFSSSSPQVADMPTVQQRYLSHACSL